ncbi:hypothetical protein [Corallococcus sicarius]|uniref:Uncharacterized protein n=1 Tax=Corallococcus sicarius TaxID=2316726 RepID=A0A3A8NUY8_9BACT|nr:hypothetical protein [Corallococcus sicarius]RKH43284.1 hypothetical protein D7X12_13680 [Corallococcus sicarius]
MRKLMKSLMAVSAVLSLAPTAAFALPPQCYQVCPVNGCEEECYVHLTPTTCAEYNPGWCGGAAATPTEPTASVSTDETRQAEDASQVCSEEHPEASTAS